MATGKVSQKKIHSKYTTGITSVPDHINKLTTWLFSSPIDVMLKVQPLEDHLRYSGLLYFYNTKHGTSRVNCFNPLNPI